MSLDALLAIDDRPLPRSEVEQLLADIDAWCQGNTIRPNEFGRMVTLWSAKLRGPGGEMLQDLAKNGPATRTTLGARMGKSSTSRWFRRGLKDLLGSNIAAADSAGVLHLHPFMKGGRP